VWIRSAPVHRWRTAARIRHQPRAADRLLDLARALAAIHGTVAGQHWDVPHVGHRPGRRGRTRLRPVRLDRHLRPLRGRREAAPSLRRNSSTTAPGLSTCSWCTRWPSSLLRRPHPHSRQCSSGGCSAVPTSGFFGNASSSRDEQPQRHRS
jgi:hypothetical protein